MSPVWNPQELEFVTVGLRNAGKSVYWGTLYGTSNWVDDMRVLFDDDVSTIRYLAPIWGGLGRGAVAGSDADRPPHLPPIRCGTDSRASHPLVPGAILRLRRRVGETGWEPFARRAGGSPYRPDPTKRLCLRAD